MTDAATVALITGGAMAATALITTGGVIVNGVITRRAVRREIAPLKTAVVEGNDQVAELKRNTDGMTTTLLELKEAKGRAEGVVEGREAAATDRQTRVAEAERVEDRQAGIAAADIHSTKAP